MTAPLEPPRLLPDEPFPPYSYVPGRFPHPESDPAGHSFGAHRPITLPPGPDDWPTCRPYLRGLDLFNASFFWESHVEFEAVWMACGRRGTTADFFKGLIKLAAAGVKHLDGRPAGVKSHAAGAAKLWREVARSPGADRELFLGLRLPELIAMAEVIHQEGWPGPSPVLLPTLPADRQGSPSP
jgi:uncharacterized protein